MFGSPERDPGSNAGAWRYSSVMEKPREKRVAMEGDAEGGDMSE